MAKTRAMRIVVATDGSPGGRAALAVAIGFPWPARSQAQGVVARSRPVLAAAWSAPVSAAIDDRFNRTAASARRALRQRWPSADVVVLDKPPAEAILAEGRGAGAIVVGSRGHGRIARLVLGSVSREVLRRAACPTLVVRARPRHLRHFLVGLDGSANARHAVEFLAELPPPRAGRVTLLRVLEPMQVGAVGRMPAGVRGRLVHEMNAMREEQSRAARRELAAAEALLKRAGWSVHAAVRWGIPIDELVNAVANTAADVLVVGARGAGGVTRLLLGSVAEGVVNRARVPVLVVR